ncbi:phage tail protein [Vibrio sp. 99-70-13A1]|uniref:phage tail protein n=1 Tax=Vibrio TaxID=662 RepID=UPI001493411D|nr:phage tail protein [Vibrio sp. 99-70-13A1]NOH95295.1 hemolysin [Vibrio sp. 99-70-13A1]
MKIPEINLRYWMGRGELAKFARAMRNYWEHVKAAFEMPLQQHDPLTAPIALVNILAWQRGVEKLGQEPEDLFRIRVAHAYGFSRDAGSVSGWEEMFEKLGYPHIAQDERLVNVDWDVVSLKIRDGDLSEVPHLLDTVVRQYGRTCRRYQYTTYVEIDMPLKTQILDGAYETAVADSPLEANSFTTVFNLDMDLECATAQ